MQFLLDLWDAVYGFILARFQTILVFALVLIFGAIAIKIVMSFTRRHVNKSKLKGTAGDFLISMIKVVLCLVYLIALLSLLGVPTTSMIALLSAFALAVSLALQGTFSNVAAGIMIVMTKPFEEGNYVDIGGTSGKVETITIFNTKLLTPDNKEVTLPNGTVTSSVITNFSTKEIRRLDLTVSAAYDNDVEKVKEVIKGVIGKHEEVLGDPAPMVRLAKHNQSSLDYTVRVWVKQKDYWPLNFDLQEEIVAAFHENGISIPFTQLDVHMIK